MRNKYLANCFTPIAAFILFSSLFLGCSPKVGSLTFERSMIIFNESLIAPDSSAMAMIMPFKSQIDLEMNDILIISEMALAKGQPESLLGNLVADLTLKKGMDYYQAPIDFCLLNNGGLRTALPEGEITRGKVFELMPFENELVVLTLSGQKAEQLFNYVARSEGMPVAGIKMGIQDKKAVNVLINGKPFNPEKEYKVITSDYLANGGDKMAFFKDPLKSEILYVKLRDAIIEFFTEENIAGRNLTSKEDGRIYFYE
ncbi:MAG: 5'-nucleotidase C-terminal domain-containing protein [Bacteroidetes bacterium]|nr:5'-nucleotidase C-terminal domain-containing protein [Bacteroidota bacterium]